MRVQTRNHWKLRLLALTFFGVGLPSNTLQVQANTEMNGIVSHLELSVSDRIISSQTPQLSPQFRQIFLTTAQLNRHTVTQYFSKYPSEVMAFRAYMQQLADLGVLSEDSSESLVIAAFKALETATQNEMLSQRAIVESKQPHKHADLNLSILSSPVSASDKTVESAPLSDYSQSETLDFGEKLEQEQKAQQAADDLEKALEEHKRIERNTKLARALIDEFSQGKPTPESLGKRIERVVTEFAEVESKKRAETLLDSVEVSINSIRNGPEYSVRGLKAFDYVNPNYFSFAEFGIVANEEDKTVNVGIGIRKLSANQTVMGGINAFYDQEIDTNHKRGSIGVELTSVPFRLSANRYYALSDGYELTALQTEKPMSGHDLNFEVAIPYFLPYSLATTTPNGTEKTMSQMSSAKFIGSEEIFREMLVSRLANAPTARILTIKIQQSLATITFSMGMRMIPRSLKSIRDPIAIEKIGPRERYSMVERQNKIVTQVSQSGLKVTFTAL